MLLETRRPTYTRVCYSRVYVFAVYLQGDSTVWKHRTEERRRLARTECLMYDVITVPHQIELVKTSHVQSRNC